MFRKRINKKTEELNKNYIKPKYYNILAHRIVLILWLLIVAALFIFVFSLCVGGIELLYHDKWGSLWTEDAETGKLNLGVLPDFLGGMAGILVGFFLEWVIFEKIKNLSKYQAILSCLEIEFKKIKKTLKTKRITICEIIIDDIVLSAENSVILYNLPGYLIVKLKGKGEILSLLQEIHWYIGKRNKALEQQHFSQCELIQLTESELKEINETENHDTIEKNGKKYRVGEPYIVEEDDNGNVEVCDKTWAELILQSIENFMAATMKEHK